MKSKLSSFIWLHGNPLNNRTGLKLEGQKGSYENKGTCGTIKLEGQRQKVGRHRNPPKNRTERTERRKEGLEAGGAQTNKQNIYSTT
jgi:hypothetical protein